MTVNNRLKADTGSENSLLLVPDTTITDKDKGMEKPGCSEWKITSENRRKAEESILEINRQKQRVLMEANIEKDQRLEELEKEINNHTTQQNEGIYWLKLQLKTTRKEKLAADERIACLQKELRNLTLGDHPHQPTLELTISQNPSMDPSITDSVGVGEGDDKDEMIAQLQDRIRIYESSFGVMQNQMALMKTSSGEIIKTLKEEIADLMEDRTRSELELLNQLSELESESRRRHLEYTLELHNKDETIEGLRNLDTCSTSANGQQASSLSTMIYNGSESTTEDTKNSILGCEIWSNEQPNNDSSGRIRANKDRSSLALRLGEENAELRRKLEQANKELKDLRSESNAKEKSEPAPRISEARRAIDLSMDRLKAVLGSTNHAVSELKGLVGKIKADEDSETENEKEKILSVLESVSLIHEEVKLSILLIELKLRNEFECLKKKGLMTETENSREIEEQRLIDDLKKIRDDTLVKLGKAEAKFSNQIKRIENRVKSGKSKLDDMIQYDSYKRSKKQGSKSSKSSSKMHTDDGLHGVQKFPSSSRSGLDSWNITDTSSDRIFIRRSVLNLLEKELFQFAECIKAKKIKIGLLNDDLEKYKAREKHLRKQLRESIKGKGNNDHNRKKTTNDSSSNPRYVVSNIRETGDDNRKDCLLSKSIPREIHPTISPVVSPIPSDHKRSIQKFKAELRRGRTGTSDDSQEGGTNPVLAPVHQLTEGDRIKSIGFIPSPPRKKDHNGNPTSLTKRLQPDSHDMRKLVFVPPCFFEDLKQL